MPLDRPSLSPAECGVYSRVTVSLQERSATERVQEARERYVARGDLHARRSSSSAPRARAIWDVDGREYIDFAGGLGCANLGHNLPAVVDAVHAQVDRYLHQCFMVGMYEPYVEVCRRLAELSPCRGDRPEVDPAEHAAPRRSRTPSRSRASRPAVPP